MKSRKTRVDRCSIAYATAHARQSAHAYLKMADDFRRDVDKEVRIKAQKCKSCFYFYSSRVSGAAITHRDCGLCGITMTYGSTRTDPLCSNCAVANGLCCQCGGDIDMKDRRKPYPFMLQEEKHEQQDA